MVLKGDRSMLGKEETIRLSKWSDVSRLLLKCAVSSTSGEWRRLGPSMNSVDDSVGWLCGGLSSLGFISGLVLCKRQEEKEGQVAVREYQTSTIVA